MSEDQAIGVVASLGALAIVGSAVLSRRRAGEHLGRYALIWLGIFVAAFAAALLIPRR